MGKKNKHHCQLKNKRTQYLASTLAPIGDYTNDNRSTLKEQVADELLSNCLQKKQPVIYAIENFIKINKTIKNMFVQNFS